MSNGRPVHLQRRIVLPAAVLLVLAGCGAPPPPPVPPTIVNVSAEAWGAVNADAAGAPSPVTLRIYQLASPAGFNGAQFFPLFDKDAATLKDDLVKRDDLLMVPGGTKTLTLKPEDRVRAIGVFAAYRDYEHVTWRALVDVPPHVTSALTIRAGREGVTAALAPPPPAAAPAK